MERSGKGEQGTELRVQRGKVTSKKEGSVPSGVCKHGGSPGEEP